MTQRERSLVFTAAGLGVGLLALVGFVRLAAARDGAQNAADRLADCKRLAATVKSQRASAPTPAAHKPQEAELIKRIESAVHAAQLPDNGIESIEPGPAVRVEGTPFREKPTTVHLSAVTLQQLFTFLHGVGAGRSGLQLKQIRLAAPSQTDPGDRWSVESTLTQLVKGSSSPDDAERDENP